MTKETIEAMLKSHKDFLEGKDGGKKADFSGANMAGIDLRHLNLTGINFSGAIMRGVNFKGADLRGAQFISSDLRTVSFSRTCLRDTDFSDASLSNINFSNSVLIGANLANAKLANICLFNTTGNGKQIKTVQLDYIINYTADRLQIGCKNYSFDEWLHFRNSKIASMDYKALEFWKKNKKAIFKIIETSPAIK